MRTRPRCLSARRRVAPSEKLLDLGDRLAPDIYHTQNTVGGDNLYNMETENNCVSPNVGIMNKSK